MKFEKKETKIKKGKGENIKVHVKIIREKSKEEIKAKLNELKMKRKNK